MPSLRTINAMSMQEFSESLGAVYESSRWVAERAFAARPFDSVESLCSGFKSEVERASVEEQRALILAHPDLAGKLARAGALTKESRGEQSRLGLDRLDETSFAVFDGLNQAYRQRFGFPFILCVGRCQDQQQVLAAFQQRLTHTPEQEWRAALDEIHWIAQLRLEALIQEGVEA
jgi:2-oxo-4-hydroxy-4-carboxy-5-ureidoimidazoline decarboxylase